MAEAWYAEKRQRCLSTSSASEIPLAAARRSGRAGDQQSRDSMAALFQTVSRAPLADGSRPAENSSGARLGLCEPVLTCLQLNPSPAIGHLAADVDLTPQYGKLFFRRRLEDIQFGSHSRLEAHLL